MACDSASPPDMMFRENMRTLRRPAYVALLLPLMVAISFNCVVMSYELHSNKELLFTVNPTMHKIGFLEARLGVYVFATMCSLLYIVLIRCSKVLKFILCCLQLAIFIDFVMVISFLFSQYPSLKEEETVLTNAVRGYGKDSTMTGMIDTTQRLLQCCGVHTFTDWKQVNTTYIADSLTYPVANRAVAIVPKTCARINKTSVQFNIGGCLPSLFSYKVNIANYLALDVAILILFETIVLFLIAAIITDFAKESDAKANAEPNQVEDIHTSDILPDSPMSV